MKEKEIEKKFFYSVQERIILGDGYLYVLDSTARVVRVPSRGPTLELKP